MIYLDSAATSFYKPPEVERAVKSAIYGGNPGRGGHRAALEAAMKIYAVREKAAAYFNSDLPEGVCFFVNATTALNVVIKSLMRGGGRVLLSDMEHNAVLRPARALEKEGVRIDFFKGYGTKEEILASFEEKLALDPRMAVFLHRSNICPQTLPAAELCALAAKKGVLTVVDCAQSAGHLPLDLEKLGADALTVPSHKGLLGIMGAGMLVCSKRMKEELERAGTLMEGGAGLLSKEAGMPAFLPERLEWGTPPYAAILSIGAGIDWLKEAGPEEIEARLSRLSRRAAEGIGNIGGLALRGTDGCAGSGGPLLFTAGDQAAVCRALYAEGVCLREGFHCAPLAHESIGTARTGGVRVSFSPFNRPGQIERFLKILNKAV